MEVIIGKLNENAMIQTLQYSQTNKQTSKTTMLVLFQSRILWFVSRYHADDWLSCLKCMRITFVKNLQNV